MLIQDACEQQVKDLQRSGANYYKARAATLFHQLEYPNHMYQSIVKSFGCDERTDEDRENSFRDYLLLVGFMAVVEHAESSGMDDAFFNQFC